MSNRIPKIVLKSLYESFRSLDETSAREKLALVEGISIDDGMALASIARQARDFQDFVTLVDAAGSETANGPVAAAKRLALLAAAESKWPWEEAAVARTPA